MKVGKVSESVLKRSVLRQIGAEREEAADGAGLGKDCAVFSVSGGFGSCMQEGSLASCEGEKTSPVERLIQKCANNLAAGGFGMRWAMLVLLLPEEAREEELKALMSRAAQKCGELGVKLAGGQTRVSSAVREPVAAVTGYGLPLVENLAEERAGAEQKSGNDGTGAKGPPKKEEAALGQDVVVSKWIGLEGTARLAERNRERLLARLPSYLVEEAGDFDRYLSVVPEAACAVKSGVCAMHDASEGGIFGALWELAERAGVGLTIDLKKLPLRQETVEVCECCNVNPYELLSGGCLVMTARDGPGLAAALLAEGIPATVVGKVTDGRDRILLNGDEVRYMDRPRQDEVYRHAPGKEWRT